MMLKIVRPESNYQVTTPWVIFSDILNVYYVAITGKRYLEMTRDDNEKPTEYLFDYTAVVGEPKRVMTVEATRKNGIHLEVAFNTAGYLLNDEGKTIERLNL